MLGAADQFGMVYSSMTCNCWVAKLTEFLVDWQTKFFAKEKAVIFAIDSFSTGFYQKA